MNRGLSFAMAATLIVGVTGCGAARAQVVTMEDYPGSNPRIALPANIPAPNPRIEIPADEPPSPATWPTYPHFSQHSCWARPFLSGTVQKVEGFAPSYAP